MENENITATVTINKKAWLEFRKQCIDMGVSASGRLSKYVQKETKKEGDINGNNESERVLEQ